MPGPGNPNPNTSGLRPPFTKENQPKNRGRKPSSVRKYIKDNNLSHADISAMAKFMLPLNQEQITTLLTDEKAPFMLRLFAKAVLSDMKKGYLDNILKIMDRAVGKPKEIVESTIDLTSQNHNIDYSHLTDDEAKQIFMDKIQGGGE